VESVHITQNFGRCVFFKKMMHVELGGFHHVHHNPNTCKPRHLEKYDSLNHFKLNETMVDYVLSFPTCVAAAA
jgi:hypothetical protein